MTGVLKRAASGVKTPAQKRADFKAGPMGTKAKRAVWLKKKRGKK